MDPSAEDGGQESLTPYQYGMNNPARYNDPDGRCPTCPPADWELQAFSQTNVTKKALTLTDANDATVIATTITRGKNAVNIDGTPASTLDKVLAGVGVFLPYVSGSAIKKGVQAIISKSDEAVEAATDVSKAGGRLGGEVHQNTVKQVANDLESQGYEITGGGGKVKEEYLTGPTQGTTKGSNYVDVTATKDGSTVRVQVGKQTKGGLPVSRERTNYVEIQKKTPNDQLFFMPYNPNP